MNRLFVSLLLVLNLSFCLATAGFYSKSGSEVVELTPATFKEFYSSKHVSVVEFYAPWCGHCQKLKSEYVKAAKSLKGVAKVGAVNCDEEANKPLCAKHGIKGFPTIKIIRPAKPEIKDGKVKRGRPVLEDYSGQRVGKEISNFALSRLRSSVVNLKDDTVDKFVAGSSKQPTFVLLAGKTRGTPTIPPVLKVLSTEYYGKAKFGYVSSKVDMWSKFGVTKHPSAKLILLNGQHIEEYDGVLTKEGLEGFIQEQVAQWKVKRDETGEAVNEQDTNEKDTTEETVQEKAQEEEDDFQPINGYHEDSEESEDSEATAPSRTEKIEKVSEDEEDEKLRQEKKEETEKYLAKKFGAKEFKPKPLKFDATKLKENGITPEAKARNPLTRISSYDDVLETCVKSDKICIILGTSGYGQLEDFKSLNGGRKALSQDDQDKLAVHFLVDVNDELRYIAEEFHMIPYRQPRTTAKEAKSGPATWTHEGALVAINGKENWMVQMPEHLGVTPIKQFLEKVLANDKSLVKEKLPGRYIVHRSHEDL